ncbi:MAG TPA: SDR family oxidoreductase [Rhizomicrobium sp.]|jgi:NAD(P)-dependent dehydrogenase (short-subunit alcohol dehydrogenase family)
MKSVVITGASTGIGWGCAKVLVEKGFRVFGSVRKLADAERLAGELGANLTPLLFDVTDSVAVRAGADRVANALGGESLFGLVNNAGIAVAGPLLYLDPDELRRQLEVNVTGQLLVTQAFARLLRQANGQPGRIVMVSSVGGRNASPFVGPYNASKFALEGLSESLRRELMLLGIDVIVVAPGAVATPIWDKAEQMDLSRYAETPYAASLAAMRDYMLSHGRQGLNPEQIGETVWRALTAARPKTRYVVTPDPLQNFLANTLPKRIVDRMIARRLGLTARR